jgi:hypothetical protein
MKTGAKQVLLALSIGTFAATGTAQEDMHWHSGSWRLEPWKDKFCDLHIVDVFHQAPGTPIRFKISNLSYNSLRYRIAVGVFRDKTLIGKTTVYVGNSHPGDTTNTQTPDFQGALSGTTLTLRVESCSAAN